MIFDHLGVVCTDIAFGKAFFEKTFSIEKWSVPIDDPIQKVTVQFGWDLNNMCYELVCPTSEDAPVQQALKDRKNILNHVGYRTADLAASAEALRQNGCFPVTQPAPAVAFGGALIQFFYSPLDFIIELIEKPS